MDDVSGKIDSTGLDAMAGFGIRQKNRQTAGMLVRFTALAKRQAL